MSKVKSASKPISKTKRPTKQDRIIMLLKRSKGASLAELSKVSDWQEHSLRGFISGTLKKRLKLNVQSSKDTKGVRLYRVIADANASDSGINAGVTA